VRFSADSIITSSNRLRHPGPALRPGCGAPSVVGPERLAATDQLDRRQFSSSV